MNLKCSTTKRESGEGERTRKIPLRNGARQDNEPEQQHHETGSRSANPNLSVMKLSSRSTNLNLRTTKHGAQQHKPVEQHYKTSR